jgi:Skp family chaperone for outer membrane proteins
VTANARISSLEAKLDASRKAFDAATAAKVSAEKSTKSALAKAKKAEKALTDANKEHLQREQAVAERLNTMSATAGGMYYTFLSFCRFGHFLMFADIFLSCYFLFPLFCRVY